MWLVEIANVLTNLGLTNTLTRYLAELHGQGREAEAKGFARWIYGRYAGLAAVGTVVVGALFLQSSQYRGLEGATLLLIALYFAQGLANINTAYLAGRQRFDTLTRINAMSVACLVIGQVAGVHLFGLVGALGGYVAGAVLPAVLSLSMLQSDRSQSCSHPDPPLRQRAWKYAVNTWLAAIVSAIVWSRAEVFFLGRYWGPGEVAMFTVGLTLSTLATQGPQLLMGALMPHFAELSGAHNMEAIRRTYAGAIRLIALLLFPLCFGGAALTPVLLPFVYGAEFAPAVPNAVVLLALSALSFAGVGSSLVYGLERSGFIAVGGLAGAVLSVVASLLVIPTYGAWGAVWSRAFVQSSMIALGTWYIARRLHCPVPFRALGRTLAVAACGAVVAYAIAQLWRAPAALGPAILAGGVAYAYGLRLAKAIEPEDIQYLRRAASRLPFDIGTPISPLISWLVRAR